MSREPGLHRQKDETRLLPLLPYETNSQWNKSFHGRLETLWLLGDKNRETLQKLGTDKDFLNRTSVAQEIMRPHEIKGVTAKELFRGISAGESG